MIITTNLDDVLAVLLHSKVDRYSPAGNFNLGRMEIRSKKIYGNEYEDGELNVNFEPSAVNTIRPEQKIQT